MVSRYRPIIGWAARRALIGRNRDRYSAERGRFIGAEASHFVGLAWSKYQGLTLSLPVQPTRGSRMNVQLAALTISLFQILLDAGIERAYAIELVSDTAWHVYKRWGRIGQFLTRILPRSLTKPLQNDVDVARHAKDGTFALGFPFDAPGYVAHYVPMKGTAAFDMIHCPVAEVSAVTRQSTSVELPGAI